MILMLEDELLPHAMEWIEIDQNVHEMAANMPTYISCVQKNAMQKANVKTNKP